MFAGGVGCPPPAKERPSPSFEPRSIFSVNLLGEGGYFAGGAAAPACKHLSPHQHRTESFTLKRGAGEGNQRGGVYEHMAIFLNVKLFIF